MSNNSTAIVDISSLQHVAHANKKCNGGGLLARVRSMLLPSPIAFTGSAWRCWRTQTRCAHDELGSQEALLTKKMTIPRDSMPTKVPTVGQLINIVATPKIQGGEGGTADEPFENKQENPDPSGWPHLKRHFCGY
jgi:hypothetical protein